jgi:CubicO group peptidase (beta-lactamase class C family)
MRTRLAIGALCVAFAACAQAQAPAPTPDEPIAAPATVVPAEAADPDAAARAELAEFVTGLAEGVLAREDIAGMVVSVVRDGRTLLAAGYGMASIDPARAADGERAMFRIGSVSKTFTYTAAMQLIEQGKLTLDDPVNERLPEALRVPDDGFAEPIRIRHLFTHSAGFEDTALGHLFERDAAQVRPLEQYLAEQRPHRVRPPGQAAVYSNYSVALLGAVVAHVSGERYEDYVEQHLTGPLGMTRTTFREPLAEADPRRLEATLAADIATGYARNAGAFEAQPFEHIAHTAPAGGASASAADMARWMRMHLGEGALDDARVLTPESATRMREVLLRNAPEAAGVAYGFLTERFGTHAAYGHGGATLQFHTAMTMVPDAELGVFVSANTDNARAPVADLARLIVEHLLPDARPAPQAVKVDAATLAQYAGVYRSNRRPYATVEKLILGVGGDAQVAAAPDGSLRLTAGSDSTRYVPIGPGLFQNAEGNQRLPFLVDASGAVIGIASSVGILERVGLLERIDVLFALIALAVLIGIVRLWRSARRRRRSADPRPGLAGVKTLSILAAIAWVGFGAALLAAAIAMTGEGNGVLYSFPSRGLMIALWLALAAAVLTGLEVMALVPVWGSDWYTWPKLRYTLAVAILALTVWVMWTWNLVGLKV